VDDLDFFGSPRVEAAETEPMSEEATLCPGWVERYNSRSEVNAVEMFDPESGISSSLRPTNLQARLAFSPEDAVSIDSLHVGFA